MRLVCLDLEGVLIPEIWIAFSEATGISELRRTTRDEPDYDKLMRFRLDILKRRGLKLSDIQRVVKTIEPFEGAEEFVKALRERTQLIILSDTYEEFARPLMAKLGYPTLLCNSLIIDREGNIADYRLRQRDGKMFAVRAFKSINMEVFASGDSFNDLKMMREADGACLFRAPQSIREQCGDLPSTDSYGELLGHIDRFLAGENRKEKAGT
jgi:phosphoserine/homoserine phosphotransferase